MSKYMFVLFISGIIPVILSFWPPLKFYFNLRSLIYSICLILFIFGGWDIFAVYQGHWYFDPASVARYRVINLPIEEVLFFIVIPFCCIFTWEAINYLRKQMK